MHSKSIPDGEADFDGAEADASDSHAPVTAARSAHKRHDTPIAGKPAG
jgi:hypothetical protein